MGAAVDIQVIDQFSDQRWRLHNLYYIVNDQGKEVHFVPNDAQTDFYSRMWYRNLLLKGRQFGFTTFIDILMLDACVFYPNQTAGIIAFTLEDVKKIFRRKIRHPYDRLPDGIRALNPPTNDTQNELVLANKSEIGVDTGFRGGTYNFLHISEYGKISAVYPEKATEIKVGSFNTVHPGNYIFVESTGHGKGGEFYDLAQASRRVAKQGRGLTPYDFKYFFYPWWQKKEYTLSEEDAKHIVITRKDQEYFAKVERRTGARLTFGQKTWYIVQREINGAEMKREFPSHDEEPFEALLRGAIFGEQMMAARAEGRITRVPHERGLAVHTWWDIGRRDKTAVWFFQMIGRELRFIWYHEQAFKEFPYWAEYCDKQRREQGWNFGQHFGPHDLGLVEYMATAGKTRAVVAAELGYVFRVGEQYNQKDQIEAARTTLPFCLFDEENCSDGITCLEQTRREWNDHLQMYLDTVVHDKFSHGGSSFMNGCMMLNGLQSGKPKAREVKRVRWAT